MSKKKHKSSIPYVRNTKQIKYYSLDNILGYNAIYNIIIGERSNGKTYAALEYGIERFCRSGYKEQFAIIRRWAEEVKGQRASSVFNAHTANNLVYIYTGGEWTDIYYYSGKWYFCRYEDEKRVKMEKPFCYAFSISAMEHDKSTSYPDVTTIVFDEFLTRTMYLPDEFILFQNVLSTIIRQRDNVKIFMLGNTVNKYSPYFAEMGLTHIKQQEQGTIDLYKYGDSGLSVAVEYCKNLEKSKQSNKYFAFENSKLQMITTGGWELNIYPHCPVKYKPNEVMLNYFIIFNGDTLQCEIVDHYEEETQEEYYFTFIHRKTTELKNKETDIVYCPEYNVRENWTRNILRPVHKIHKKILEHFRRQKIFYQDNEVGEIVWNYLNWAKKNA